MLNKSLIVRLNIILFVFFLISCENNEITNKADNKSVSDTIKLEKDTLVVAKDTTEHKTDIDRVEIQQNIIETKIVVEQVQTKLITQEEKDEINENPLSSWNDNETKQRIIDFVNTITDKNSKSYVKPENRIASVDIDGTLWAEKPLYFQLYFVFDRIKAMVPDHPKWKRDKLIQAVLKGDVDKIRTYGPQGLAKLMTITQSEMYTDEFENTVLDWIKIAKHPETNRYYTEMIYQPMLELINYFKANEIKVYLVSEGGIDFIRPWSEIVFGIPKEQVIGSRQKLELQFVDNKPVLFKNPKVEYVNSGKNKVISIYQIIGKVPIISIGNSDDDISMLEWTYYRSTPHLVAIVHHTDDDREYYYDKDSKIGKLNEGLILAKENNWLIFDVKNDWKKVFSFE